MIDETPSVNVRTKPEGLVLMHPSGAVANNAGGVWPRDQFFARRLLDKDIEEVEVKANDAPPQGDSKTDDVGSKAGKKKD